MEYVLSHWSPDFAVSLVISFLSVLAGGVFLAGLFWITGYIVHHLFKTMKGGV